MSQSEAQNASTQQTNLPLNLHIKYLSTTSLILQNNMLKTGNLTEHLNFIYRGKTKVYRKDTRVAQKKETISFYMRSQIALALQLRKVIK